ncbi:MAG: hypothetical protein C0615_06265 [Desulfuromonas sp.]|nr:MAG: hypothetical protein C0615_06265 [Desulfuromonas sp.]
MDQEKQIRAFRQHSGAGILSSSDGAGAVNAAVFGSLRELDEQHVAIALGECRTLHNLKVDGRAVYLFYTPGETLLDWQGGRLYLEAVRFEKDGELFENLVAETEQTAGRMAAGMLRCAIVFRILETRPLIDLSP